MTASRRYLLAAKYARSKGVETFDLMALVMPMALITATPVVLVIAGDQMWPLSWKAWVAVAILSVMTGMVAPRAAGVRPPTRADRDDVDDAGQPAGVVGVRGPGCCSARRSRPQQVPGMALVIIGLALVSWSSHERRPQPV